jgi:hypothetical protein
MRKTQAAEVQRREEKFLEEEQQNIAASFEHVACSEHCNTTGAKAVKRLLCINALEIKSTGQP